MRPALVPPSRLRPATAPRVLLAALPSARWVPRACSNAHAWPHAAVACRLPHAIRHVDHVHTRKASFASRWPGQFLEGLIFCALELPPPHGVSRPAAGLTTNFVLSSVHALLEQKVFKHAQSSQVLATRRALLDSVALSEALEAIKKSVDPIFSKLSTMPARPGAQGKAKPRLTDAAGVGLRHFLELCDDSLIGRQLSRVQVTRRRTRAW